MTALQPVQRMLPLWNDDRRGLPNGFARTALFRLGSKKEPREVFTEDTMVQGLKGYEMSYRGVELRQDDADVFMQLLHLARGNSIEAPVTFSARTFLLELRWGTSSDDYDRLIACLERMQGNSIQLRIPGQGGFRGPMILKFYWKESSNGKRRTDWTVHLDRDVIKLFSPDSYTLTHWEQRLKLRYDLSKWMHNFYSTHRDPFPMQVATIKNLCGSRTNRLCDFRKQVVKSLAELSKVGFFTDAIIDEATDQVRVIRYLSN